MFLFNCRRPMASSNRSTSSCSEGDEGNVSHSVRKPGHRHTSHQIERLEEFFKHCAHPNEKQRRQLGTELGMEPRQIKFWFQNKRTQTKVQNERADNDALRRENDRIRSENAFFVKALKGRMCRRCGGAPITKEETIDELQQENNALVCQYVRRAYVVTKHMGRLVSGPTFNRPGTITTGLASETDSLMGNISPENIGLADQMKANPELEKLLMAEIAPSAMNELIKLLGVDQHLLIKSPVEEEHVLDHDGGFSKHNRRMESSKDFGVIAMDARSLVDLYLDPDKWVDFFPTVFSDVKKISVERAGLQENRSDSLQMIHEQMFVLSPVVQQREFCLLRYCQKIKSGTWVIVDVSYNFRNMIVEIFNIANVIRRYMSRCLFFHQWFSSENSVCFVIARKLSQAHG
ncbi:hypothetical protein RND81_04G033900 [Saponaria officinalis]|uniref:Uncharacterized protein n=1 Tax=Saponaria officinalis TaxID=3572 RepID=A0AAW1LIX1_SAPOF